MNKISKVYMGVAMITSVLIFLFGLYFSTKGIVEVMYESWRAIGVSCLAFLLTLFSMMKLPFKIKKGIIALELILMIAVFGPMIIKGTILNFQSFPFGVIVDLTIVFTVLLMILLGLSTRRIYPDKESTIDSIFINLQMLWIFFGILIVFGSILKMFSDTFRGKNMKDSIMSVSK